MMIKAMELRVSIPPAAAAERYSATRDGNKDEVIDCFEQADNNCLAHITCGRVLVVLHHPSCMPSDIYGPKKKKEETSCTIRVTSDQGKKEGALFSHDANSLHYYNNISQKDEGSQLAFCRE